MADKDGKKKPIELPPDVYEDLKKAARNYLNGRRAGGTLGTTALVHETYLKLVNKTRVSEAQKTEFFAIAACAMRSVLADHARRRQAQKRSGDGGRTPLDHVVDRYQQRSIDLVALDEALTRLATVDPYLTRLVEIRFFGGLTIPEAAATLQVSERTVRRDWQVAKLWLRKAIGEDLDDAG